MASIVDERPVVIDSFSVDGRRYRTSKPLSFAVRYDRDEGLFFLEGEYRILLWAETREFLLELLEDELQFLWTEYAEGRPEELTEGAQRLGAELRERFEEVADAA